MAFSCLQRYKIMRDSAAMAGSTVRLLALAHAQATTASRRARLRAATVLLLGALAGARLLLSTPRDHSATYVPLRFPIDFHESEFRDHFRFSRDDFFRLLSAMHLANLNDVRGPRYMRICRRLVRTDWALMVLLKRMASPAAYKDLRFVVGGTKTALCVTFLWMLERVFNNHCHKCTSLLPWEDYMEDFAAMLRAKSLSRS